ncbi:MAG TPA: alpha/beta hydrolase [Massilia sp.]|jgi:alpha/beta superfamily hydrolase|uniref:alpha/beta hydrolase n=1 Tax=Massilia sp. TaxID=1882437 RepID=UPI000E96945E|nr:alpha/beta fold hydrolase [Massilia sp.]HAV34972.1 alpha/beta hydrolase [Massilia sp.]
MNKFSKKFYLTGHAGKMECLLDLPEEAPRGIALVAHPHPLYGGTMENKVTQTLARTFVTLGYATARFNFRGVGESEGEHDRGHGEVDDMQVMLEHMQEQYPGLPVALSGFSFGTFVQAQLQARLAAEGKSVQRMVLVGTAAGKWPMPSVPEDTILIHGEQDDTITLQMVFDWARPLEIPVIVIPGADHFFHRRLNPIKNLVIQMWDRNN